MAWASVANCDGVRHQDNALCRSELARDELLSATFSLKARVIVNDHREQARSYRKLCLSQAETVVAK